MLTASPTSAHRSAVRVSLPAARGAAGVLPPHMPQPVQRYRRIVSNSVVGRHPSASCASLP